MDCFFWLSLVLVSHCNTIRKRLTDPRLVVRPFLLVGTVLLQLLFRNQNVQQKKVYETRITYCVMALWFSWVLVSCCNTMQKRVLTSCCKVPSPPVGFVIPATVVLFGTRSPSKQLKPCKLSTQAFSFYRPRAIWASKRHDTAQSPEHTPQRFAANSGDIPDRVVEGMPAKMLTPLASAYL